MVQHRALMLALAFAATALLTACPVDGDLEKQPEYASGDNATRQGADEISLGATIIDDVDPKNGDTTDWKYVTIPGPGIVSISITFDNPKARGEMIITDEVGKIQSTYKDETRGLLDKITFKSQTGRYYMQIFSNDEGTSYSLEVTYRAI